MADIAYTNAARHPGDSYISWSAVIAGGLIATAYSFILLLFGAAAGLSFATPFEREGTTQAILLVAVALWLIWVQVSGFALGGYIAGRIRSRVPNATDHEIDMRDGIHGILVWAAGALLTFLFALFLTGSAIGLIGQGANALMSAGGERPAPTAGLSADVVSDELLRTTGNAQRPGAETREEVSRLVAPALTGGSLEQDNRQYLARLVASTTGLSQGEADARVDQVLLQASEAAEDARITAIIIGFIVVASLLISAAAAWWAATEGGDHRDRAVDLSRYIRPARPASGRSVAYAQTADGHDLTRIKGIGPTLQEQLNEMGVHTISQVAELSQEDIKRISEELNFPGRIEREDWVGQARVIAGK